MVTEEQIQKAKHIPLDALGDDAVFVDGAGPGSDASPSAGGDGWSPSAYEDPALEGEMPEKSLEEKQHEWRGLLKGVFGATGKTLDIVKAPVTLEDAEAQQLAEVWGDVLGHYYNLQDGTRKGDIAKAVAETTVIAGSKLKQIKAAKNERDTAHDYGGTGQAGRGQDVPNGT